MSVPETPPANTPGWREWFSLVDITMNSLRQSGTTLQRPTVGIWTGRVYFDTDFGQPIWYDGTLWVDASGSPI